MNISDQCDTDNTDNINEHSLFYKENFKEFLYENTSDDTELLAKMRDNKVKRFYFIEFLEYEAGIVSEFWCCYYGKYILKKLENDENYDILLDDYEKIIHNIFYKMTLEEYLTMCDDMLL